MSQICLQQRRRRNNNEDDRKQEIDFLVKHFQCLATSTQGPWTAICHHSLQKYRGDKEPRPS